MRDRKILLTGLTGQVALPVALALAPENEVWGIARFSDPEKRRRLEEGGVHCKTVDLSGADLRDGDLGSLPNDFDYVLNFAVSKSGDFEADLRANAESAGRLMSHCRAARAFLHCSTTGVYQPDGHTAFTEESPLGDNHRVLMPTYSIAKISAEAVVRFAAREFDLPTVIARLNVPYGSNGGWPYIHLLMMKQGVPIPVHTDAPSVYTPIHEDDIVATLPGLLEAASVPARIVNWAGQEHVSIEEWCAYMGELTGLEPKLAPTDQTLESVKTDNRLMRELAGPARVPWKDGIRRMIEALQPDWIV